MQECVVGSCSAWASTERPPWAASVHFGCAAVSGKKSLPLGNNTETPRLTNPFPPAEGSSNFPPYCFQIHEGVEHTQEGILSTERLLFLDSSCSSYAVSSPTNLYISPRCCQIFGFISSQENYSIPLQKPCFVLTSSFLWRKVFSLWDYSFHATYLASKACIFHTVHLAG